MSATNAQKTPLARSLESFANRKVMGQLARLGMALPAQVTAVEGSIVTVSFLLASTAPYTLSNVTMPIDGPEWARAPTQIGDLGVCRPASVYIGGVSGLGGGVADLSQRAPLATLTFFPIGNANWSPSDNPNAWVLYGPDGVILRTQDKTVGMTIAKTGFQMTGLPTSSVGLLPGSLWNSGGTVMVIG
jgi:hypothetical protein